MVFQHQRPFLVTNPLTSPSKRLRAFTLVEIMIVVVIIGLLAVMAIPTFNAVNRRTLYNTMVNDARQLGSGAQQYFLETGEPSITFSVARDGTISGPMENYLDKISPNYLNVSGIIEIGGTFSISHRRYEDGTPLVFYDNGSIVD